MRILLAVLSVLLGLQAAYASPPDVVLKQYKGKPVVFIDGRPHALPGYSTFRREAFEEDLPLFYEHGMGVYFIEPPKLWWDGGAVIRDDDAAGAADFISLDAMAEHILDGDPNAWIIVRFTPPCAESLAARASGGVLHRRRGRPHAATDTLAGVRFVLDDDGRRVGGGHPACGIAPLGGAGDRLCQFSCHRGHPRAGTPSLALRSEPPHGSTRTAPISGRATRTRRICKPPTVTRP